MKSFKATSKYAEKLRDPRWQRMRLEILGRDEFTCQRCGDSESALNVHHHYYKPGADPWDYPPAALVTLCESCHQEESEGRKPAEHVLLHALRAQGFSYNEILSLADSIGSDWAGASVRPRASPFDGDELSRREESRWAVLCAVGAVMVALEHGADPCDTRIAVREAVRPLHDLKSRGFKHGGIKS